MKLIIQIPLLIQEGMMLINTSVGEGFSNTFIEAWNQCIPVISLNSDPDKCINHYKLGYHSATFENMFKNANKLINNKILREEFGRNGKLYIKKNTI